MSFGVDPEVLHYEMVIRGLSGRDLAQKAGRSDATVSNARAGKSISETSLQLIARALTTTPVDEGIRRLLNKKSNDSGDQP